LLLRFPQKYLLFESAVATQLEKKQTGATYAGNSSFLMKMYFYQTKKLEVTSGTPNQKCSFKTCFSPLHEFRPRQHY
jgi:hypothetical protein